MIVFRDLGFRCVQARDVEMKMRVGQESEWFIYF